MIKTIPENRLRNGEFIQFMSDVVGICSKSNTETLGITEQCNALSSEVNTLQNSFGKERGSDITAELSQIDERRDNCIVAIRNISEAYTLHYQPIVANSGKKILNKIDSFGSRIAKQNYQTETSIITNLCKAFNEETELNAALNALNLKSWADKLQTENDLFAQRFLDRIDESAQQSEEKFKAQRENVTTAYRTLCQHINAHVTLKGEADYLVILAPLNELIDSYSLLIKRRSSTSEETEV